MDRVLITPKSPKREKPSVRITRLMLVDIFSRYLRVFTSAKKCVSVIVNLLRSDFVVCAFMSVLFFAVGRLIRAAILWGTFRLNNQPVVSTFEFDPRANLKAESAVAGIAISFVW